MRSLGEYRGRLLLAGVSTLAGLLLAELGFRVLESPLGVDQDRLSSYREFVATGAQAASFEARAHVVYARPRNLPDVNPDGFTAQPFVRARRPGVTRVVCLGASTTEGGNPLGARGSYPHLLEELLRERLERDVEVLNLGMSGWTSAEIMVSYFLTAQDLAADVVLLHAGVNDVEARNWPGFRADYAHYRRPWTPPRFSAGFRLLVRGSDLFACWQLRRSPSQDVGDLVNRPPGGPFVATSGPLPEETAQAFRRNMRTIADHVRLRGGRPVFVTIPWNPDAGPESDVFREGLREHNQVVRSLAVAEDFGLLDLEARSLEAPGWLQASFRDLVHLEREGNRRKAEAIADYLAEVEAVPAPPQ